MKDERIKQVCIGAGAFLLLTVLLLGGFYASGVLPGVPGEWVRMIVGALTTPFIMETCFVILGFVVVVSINGFRRQSHGSEFVNLEDFDKAESTHANPCERGKS